MPRIGTTKPVRRKTALVKQAKRAGSLSRPLVAPSADEPKSGCMFCSLLPMCVDFENYEAGYQRDAEKILGKLKEPHTIHCRGVSERPWKQVDVLFVGEAPGKDEDSQGIPFVGRSGHLLRNSVKEYIPESVSVAFANVARCRPPLNRDPNKTEIKSCTPELMRELAARKPKVIVPLGNISLELFTGQTGITTVHGKVMRCIVPGYEDVVVVPSFHPAYVLRFDYELDRFVEAIELVGEVAQGKHAFLPGEGDYYVLDDIEDIEAILLAFVEDNLPTAFDTECGSLSCFDEEFPRLLCFSFSNEEGTAFTVPFDHADSPWRVGGPKEHERERLIEALRTFFESKLAKVAQNEKFDRQHILHAIGIVPVNVSDTMLTHFVLDDRRGTHGLKTQAFTYTGMGGYERPLELYVKSHKEANPRKGGSYANIPGSILFVYCGMDSDVTLRVHYGLRAETEYRKNKAFRVLAEVYLPELAITLADIEYRGALMDVSVVEEMDVDLSAQRAALMVQIRKLPKVRKFVADQIAGGKRGKRKADAFEFNPGSDQQLRRVLFKYYGLQPTELTDTGFKTLVARLNRLKVKNPDLRFSDVIADSIKRKEWDFYSVKADVLHEYDRLGNDLAPLLLKYRTVDTLLGTFIKPVYDRLDKEGKVHGTFMPHGTVTGRLASRDPNLQNIPYRAKRAYVSRFGDEGVIMEADYSQIELRVAACWYNEPVMIEAFLRGDDMHTLTGASIFSVTTGKPESEYYKLSDKARKGWRARAKTVNFAVLFGGGPPAVVTALRKNGIFITPEEARDLIEAYFKVRPGLKRGIKAQERDVRKRGFLESFTGRRRRVPEVFATDEQIVGRALRQSINFPIQSGASDMTLMSLILINRVLKAEGFRSCAVLTVHDSTVLDCHVDEVFEVARIVKDIMENIMVLSDEVLPGLDWKWLRVPLVAEIGIGVNWQSLVKFDIDVIEKGEACDKPLHWLNEQGELQHRDPVTVDEIWELMPLVADAA